MQFTVVLLQFVQINLNLPYREGYKCRKSQFQAYFHFFLPKNDIDLDLIIVNMCNLLKEYNIVYNIKMFFLKSIQTYLPNLSIPQLY